MGASGKNLHGHGQRSNASSPPVQVKDGPYGRPPHPRFARTGQIYWPRKAPRRRQFRITRVLNDGTVRGRRTDGPGEAVHVTQARLLAADERGVGEAYSFIGWFAGLYGTWACLVERPSGTDVATVVVPEWHPRWPIHIPHRALPIGVTPGAWMLAIANLSAPYPARLGLGLSERCDDPGRDLCPAPSCWIDEPSREPRRFMRHGERRGS